MGNNEQDGNYYEGQGTLSLGTRDGIRINNEHNSWKQGTERGEKLLGRSVVTKNNWNKEQKEEDNHWEDHW